MTAVIAYVTESGAHLLSDGMTYGPDGGPTALKQKVTILAHQSAAFVARGPDVFSGLLGVIVAQFQGDFDALTAEFGGMCRKAHHAMMEAAKAGALLVGDPGQVDVVLVGASGFAFAAYCVSSYPEGDVGAWALRPLLSESALVFASPMDEPMVRSLQQRGLDVWAERVSVETHGLALMREQRRSSPLVGGFCQLTTVMRSGVFTSILERWPVSKGKADPLSSIAPMVLA